MSAWSPPTRRRVAPGRAPLFALLAGVVILLTALWLVAVTRQTHDGGSLDSRAAAVGATVRCPVCPQPIALNDVTGQSADETRQFIRAKLQGGASEDEVRQALVAQYGARILLAPPQQGFDALVWFAPLLVVAACAVGLLVSIRRWSVSAPAVMAVASTSAPPDPSPAGEETRRYEELLDRELRRRG